MISLDRLKSFILDKKIISEIELIEVEDAAKKSGKKLKDVLIEKNLISEKELAKLESYILGVPFIDLKELKIPSEILRVIPEPIARKNNIIAFKKSGNDLFVAMLDPEDLQTIEFIRKKSNLKIIPRITDEAGIRSALEQYQKSLEAEFGEIIKKDSSLITAVLEEKKEEIDEKEELQKIAEDLPIIKIVDTLVKHAILQNASDIHIEPLEKELVVRYRIDGILHDAMILPKQIQSGVVARIKILANLKIDEHRLPQDGRFKIEIPDHKISFRVSILPVADGEKIVMRLLEETVHGFTLESSGLYGEALEKVYLNIKKPLGMVLVTGPTGSGKTTTLYSIIDILNTPEINISTIEDPIEYRMPRVNQTQVNPAIGLTFANGLRSLLRQDPNAIMVGEIRDEETASLAVNAALTGHLVFSTLHTNSAAGALPRLIDMNVEPFLIASTVNCIIAQRLVRKLCPEKERYRLTADQINNLKKEFDMERILGALKKEKIVSAGALWETIDFYKPKATVNCPDGYKGRIGIFEILQMSEKIKSMIMKSANADDIEKMAKEDGMFTMYEDGFIKAVQGLTSIEEILRVTRE